MPALIGLEFLSSSNLPALASRAVTFIGMRQYAPDLNIWGVNLLFNFYFSASAWVRTHEHVGVNAHLLGKAGGQSCVSSTVLHLIF